MTDEERARRGREAKDLMENPLLKEAVSEAEAAYWRSWKASPVRDADGREKIYERLKALEDVMRFLESLIEDGKLSQSEIDRLASGKRSFF